MLGIKDYFSLDFPYTLRATYELEVLAADGRKYTVSAQSHLDTVALVKFTSFYIPQIQDGDLLKVCRKLFAYVPEILVLTKPNNIQLPKTDKSRTGEIIMLKLHDEYVDVVLQPLDGGEYPLDEFSPSPIVYIYSEADLTPTDKEQFLLAAKKYGLKMRYRGPDYAAKRLQVVAPDAFVSHDSRDKEAIALPLAQGLVNHGYNVWFDQFSLRPGDRLRESIEEGMKTCRRCVLILTPNFLTNVGWTAAEFNMIFTREILESKRLVVPVWAGVTKEQIYAYSPTLLNVVGAQWDDRSQEASIKEVERGLDSDGEAGNWTSRDGPEQNSI